LANSNLEAGARPRLTKGRALMHAGLCWTALSRQPSGPSPALHAGSNFLVPFEKSNVQLHAFFTEHIRAFIGPRGLGGILVLKKLIGSLG
jgi:hypothetical protein